MAVGKAGGGYATINRSQNYLGGAMQNAQDNAYRFRQERKVKEDEAKVEKEKIDNEINAGLGKISSDTTRFSTQNALIIDATHKLRNAVAEKANLYKQGKISKLDYDTFYANAKSQVDNIDQSAKRINAQSAEASNQIKEGKVNPAFAEYMANAGNAYDKNNISLNLKDDGTFESVLYDDNDNIIEVSDLSKFGVKTFTPITDYDLDKDLSDFVKTYPKVLNEEIKNNLKIGNKGTAPEIETAINEKVNSTLKDRNQMAIINYKRTGRVIPDVTDPKEIEANKEYLKNLYNGLYAPEKFVDEALQGANYSAGRDDEYYQRKKDAEAKAKADAEENDKKPNIKQPSIVIKAGLKDNVKLQKGAKDFPITNAIIKNAGGTETKATNVYVNSGGKMYLRVEKHGVGSQTEKNDDGTKSTTSKLIEVQMLDFGKDGDQIGRYAQKLGYAGANEFKEDMIARSGGNKFITTPNERKPKSIPKVKAKTTTKKTTPAKTIQFDAEGNIID